MSNEDTPQPGTAGLTGPAAIAAEQFERAMTRINQVLRELEQDPARAAREVMDETRLLRKALENIYEERRRIRALGGNDDAGGGAKLDLAAARDEIGRRLACLRAAGGGA